MLPPNIKVIQNIINNCHHEVNKVILTCNYTFLKSLEAVRIGTNQQTTQAIHIGLADSYGTGLLHFSLSRIYGSASVVWNLSLYSRFYFLYFCSSGLLSIHFSFFLLLFLSKFLYDFFPFFFLSLFQLLRLCLNSFVFILSFNTISGSVLVFSCFFFLHYQKFPSPLQLNHHCCYYRYHLKS